MAFNPDQARDAHGMWSAGGSISAPAASASLHASKLDGQGASAKERYAAHLDAAQAHLSASIKHSNIASANSMNAVAGEHTRFSSRHEAAYREHMQIASSIRTQHPGVEKGITGPISRAIGAPGSSSRGSVRGLPIK